MNSTNIFTIIAFVKEIQKSNQYQYNPVWFIFQKDVNLTKFNFPWTKFSKQLLVS